jgi:2-oxoglutarate ferredoxin oxidoreductase subunit delta
VTSQTPSPTTADQSGAEELLPVQFRYEWCKKCGICVAYCPRNALSTGARDLPILSNVAACTQCKLCELMCPDFAITVTPRRRAQASKQEGETA